MKPRNHKEFKEGIAQEVGVHQNVVDDFINFYYSKLRKELSSLTYPKVFVEGLGTFTIRKKQLDTHIKRNKSILGNITKTTYKGYEKTIAVKEKLELMERVNKVYEEILKSKREFKEKKWTGKNSNPSTETEQKS